MDTNREKDDGQIRFLACEKLTIPKILKPRFWPVQQFRCAYLDCFFSVTLGVLFISFSPQIFLLCSTAVFPFLLGWNMRRINVMKHKKPFCTIIMLNHFKLFFVSECTNLQRWEEFKAELPSLNIEMLQNLLRTLISVTHKSYSFHRGCGVDKASGEHYGGNGCARIWILSF